MRDGEGELFPEFDRDDAIAKLADDIMTEVPDSFKSRLVTALAAIIFFFLSSIASPLIICLVIIYSKMLSYSKP